MPTFAEALADIGATELPGTDLIVAIPDGRYVHHYPLALIMHEEIDPGANIYLTGGVFEKGAVTEFEGRAQENLRSVLWLQFDADLVDFIGIPKEALHTMPQSDLDTLIDAQRADLESIFREMSLPIHRLDYTGYGLCAYLYLEPTLNADIPTIRAAHKAFIKAINSRAGIKLVDPQASDSGTRITRIPGTYNVKNPSIPRLVRTLSYQPGKHVTMDQVKFALKRARQAPDPAAPIPRTSLPDTMADEVVQAVRPHWTEGQKHHMALALSGMLAKAGIPEEQTLSIIERLSDGDNKPVDRVRCVQDTYKRLQSSIDVQGFMSLKTLMPDTVLSYITERLDRVKGATAPQGVFAFKGGEKTKKDDKFVSSLNVAPVPDICFNGWVGDYVSMMLPLSEAPESFHLASGLGLIGASAGRRVSARYISKNLYANLYLMIVGIAGYSRKDTAIEFAVNMPEHMDGRSYNTSPYQVLTDVGSPQGLMEQLEKHQNIWLYVTEYERLASNAHRSSTSAIFPLLTTAWNTPTKIQNITKGSAIEAKFPYLSVIAAVQPDVLATHMLPEDISNGFASRWLFVPGEGGDPLDYPPDIDEVEAHHLYGRLLAMIEKYGDREREARLSLSPKARERWRDWYHADRRHVPQSDDEASMRSRLGVHIQKTALVYAIGNGEREAIQLDQLDSAIAFVEWSWLHTKEMLKTWGSSPMNTIETRIESALKKHGSLRRRDLQRLTAGRKWGATDFAKVLEAMVRNGTVEVDPEGNHALAS